MKSFLFVSTLAAALFLAGCATNESTQDDNQSTGGGNEVSSPMEVVNGTDDTPMEPTPTTNETMTNETSETPMTNETNESSSG